MKPSKSALIFLVILFCGFCSAEDATIDNHTEEIIETKNLESNEIVASPEHENRIEESKTIVGNNKNPKSKPESDTESVKVFKDGDDNTNYDSITSRVAPPMESQHGGIPYVINEARLKEIRAQFMYWYFDRGGRNNEGDFQKYILSSSPQIQKNFNFQLPFFGFRFNYTRISLHGYLEFSDPPEYYSTYPLIFPIREWPKKNDPSFIGPFYSTMRIGAVRVEDVDQRKAGVYFRLERDLQTRTDQFGVELRERLMWDIREGIIGSETFVPKHSIIATWKNMTYAGGIDKTFYITNTFQVVLATDEVFTYAMFNYLDINWTTHTEAGGDVSDGEGGIPAFVGFNAGNGTQAFEYYPYSQRSTIRDLTKRGCANGFKGRHIFRIDEKITLGTCNNEVL